MFKRILIKLINSAARNMNGLEINNNIDFWYLVNFFFKNIYCLIRANIKLLANLKFPKKYFIGKNSEIDFRLIKIGKKFNCGDYVRLVSLTKYGIQIGNRFTIGSFSIITNGYNAFGKIGSIEIGTNVGIGEFSYICAPSRVKIGDNTIVGQYLSIHPQNHVFEDLDKPIRAQGTTEKGIQIGSNCWIGAKVTFLDGSSIGDGCVVGAGTIVTKKFPSNSVIAGNPARLIKMREQN
jgi:acetyltransferase-like isoleucine patch superfamily enzyme